jgi:hypothetical protein
MTTATLNRKPFRTAPDFQVFILFPPRIDHGRDTIHLRDLQPISQTPAWGRQRKLWSELRGRKVH